MLEVVTALDVGPLAVIFMILLVYFLLGCVFESLSMMLLTVPVFAPVVAGLGLFSQYGAMGEELSLIWFGIFVVVATEISLITPPVGLNVYVLKGVIGDVATGTIFRGITPFWAVDIVRLVLLVFIPYMAIALPLTMQN